MNDYGQKLKTQKLNANYHRAQNALLAIFILSIINYFITRYIPIYFPFSAMLPCLFNTYALTGGGYAFLLRPISTAIFIVPYLLCWIKSQDYHFHWITAALIYYLADAAVLLISPFFIFMWNASSMDALSYVASPAYFVDNFFHFMILYYLAKGVKAGHRLTTADPEDFEQTDKKEEPLFFSPDARRTIIITRKGRMFGCAMSLICYINGEKIGKVRNGKTQSFSVPANKCELGIAYPNSDVCESIVLPNGIATKNIQVSLKMCFPSGKIIITPVNN